MESFQSVLLSVWQEACRHIEIEKSTATIAAMLVQHLPIDHVLVRRIDPQRTEIVTVAAAFPGGERRIADARTVCSPEEWEALAAWRCRGRATGRVGEEANNHSWLAKLAPGEHRGDILVGPLGSSSGHGGAIVLIAPPGDVFMPEHAELAQLLLEPFSTVLENDLRMRELAALREAAEADKRSLLTKLGRKAIGETIVGVESGLHAVMQRVELVARSDAPVLIFGETGTGKELIARSIHNRSARCNGPFDRVNCGAIPPELIDSQLFGHERGAFTGAVESRRGWFERADGGTLFLDEIGELPPAAQVRMLRILQDGWMERVGAEKSIHVDVRIVAATHRDLASMVAEGRFREDLWYRIAVFPVVLPPLRERREDIASLAVHFAERAATRFGLAPASPTAEDISMLTAYPWPGNVRELAAVIDRAAILGDGRRLDVATALGTGVVPPPVARPAPNRPPVAPTHVEPLDVAVRRHIEAALRAAHGQIEGRGGAASLLKINPHTLRARMRKLGIAWADFRPEKT